MADSLELNLPPQESTDNQENTKKLFNTFYKQQLSYAANDVDAVVGFLESKGFETEAAKSTGAILLQQAKIDNVKVFELLDTLKGLNKLQLSYAVAQVINFNRQKISALGFKVDNTTKPIEARNIMG